MIVLTSELVSKYVGGQMEIQNTGEKYLFRGDIATATVEKDTLKVRFAWLAKGEGFPPFPERWVNKEDLDYAASLMIYSVSEIGDGRLSLYSSITGELTVLFPPDGSKLDRREVVGLESEN